MLVLTRGIGESLFIEPAGIKVTVIGVLAGGRVRVGIEAPKHQQVLREELRNRYQGFRKEADRNEQRRRADEDQSAV